MSKIIIYPSPNKKQTNSYIYDFCNAINAINKSYTDENNICNLIRNIFKGDTYVFNWPENIIYRKWGVLQYWTFIVIIHILIVRKAKIIWVFHNITPHQKHNKYTSRIYALFFKKSNLIITHSQTAYNYLKKYANCKIWHHPHPFKNDNQYTSPAHVKKEWDILIWGSIEKYKGILEFLNYLKDNMLLPKYKIMIIGKCNDEDYANKIKEMTNGNIVFENRFANFKELKELSDASEYILFPYLKNSISSSGALMDSLLFGASVIGPNIGAFQDLNKANLCHTFNNYEDIINIIKQHNKILNENILSYIKENTWNKFAVRFLQLTY